MTFDLRVLDPYHVSADTSKKFSVAGYSEVMHKYAFIQPCFVNDFKFIKFKMMEQFFKFSPLKQPFWKNWKYAKTQTKLFISTFSIKSQAIINKKTLTPTKIIISKINSISTGKIRRDIAHLTCLNTLPDFKPLKSCILCLSPPYVFETSLQAKNLIIRIPISMTTI